MPPHRGVIPAPEGLLSKTDKGFAAETAVDTLVLVLSGGALHLAQVIPDDRKVDRLLFRPRDLRARALQVKSCFGIARGRYYSFTITAPKEPVAARDVLLLACPLQSESPWIGPDLWTFPLSQLGPVPPRGAWSLVVPRDPAVESKWARFRHPVRELAEVFDRLLDEGPSTAACAHGACALRPGALLPPSLSPPARGRVHENEFANLVAFHSRGRLELLKPLTDDFGVDFAVVRGGHGRAAFVQIKGAFTRGRNDVLQVEVEARTFQPARDRLFVVLEYRIEELRHGPFVWVVPAAAFAKAAARVRGNYKFDGSADPNSSDKWTRWRHEAKDVAAVIVEAMDRNERGT